MLSKSSKFSKLSNCLIGGRWLLRLAACLFVVVVGEAGVAEEFDRREITRGLVIPDEGYCDQPYVVVMPRGAGCAR